MVVGKPWALFIQKWSFPIQENLRDLCDWVTQKDLEINIAKTFPMQEFREVYRFARQGGVIGKVVFTVS